MSKAEAELTGDDIPLQNSPPSTNQGLKSLGRVGEGPTNSR